MNKTLHFAAAAFVALAATGNAFAQATITHDKALAGNVTPGDSAGYPVTINQPGHYKLMSNLTVPAGMTGVVINANGVTLDLNGFGISGPNICTRNAASGVVNCSIPRNDDSTGFGVLIKGAAVLRNGFVRGTVTYGVYTDGDAANVRIEGVHVSHVAAGGIACSYCDVVGSSVQYAAGAGMELFDGRIADSRATKNGAEGLKAPLVERSSAVLNGAVGIFGAARGSYVRGNVAGNHFGKSLGGNINGDSNVAF